MLLKKTLKKLIEMGFGNYQVNYVFGIKQVRAISSYQSNNKLILTNIIAKNSTEIRTLKDLYDSFKLNVEEIVGECSDNNESYSTFNGIDIDHRINTAVFTWMIDEEHPKEDQYLLDASY